MNTIKFLFYTLAILCVLNSCERSSNVPPIEFGYDYFPLKAGKYIEYEVDSVIYDISANGGKLIDTNSIQIREEITDSFPDNEGRIVYRIERYERKNADQEWLVQDVWTATVTDRQAERTEENLRFIKLVFPISENTSAWNGNQYIDEDIVISVAGESILIFKNWLYEYRDFIETVQIGTQTFDDVVTVYQADEENFIELRRSFEQYAKGIGLIYREMKILDTQCIGDCLDDTWEEKAEKGFIIKQRITDFN